MRNALALALVLAGILSYFAASTVFGIYQRWPVAHFAVIAAGLAVGISARLRASSRGARIRSALVLGIGGFFAGAFAWYTLSYSSYGDDRGLPAGTSVVAQLSGLELPNAEGRPMPVWTADDRGTLLVFYRGFW